MAVTRRFFLKSTGVAVAGFAAVPSFLQRAVFAQATRGGGKDRPILIAIFQRGAADGISMVAPFGDAGYASARPQIAIPDPKSGREDTAIDLDGFFGFHPGLAAFKPIYDEGHLAIVHAVGSPDSTRSHFDAQDYMESATPGSKITSDGWLNRYMRVKKEPKATPFRAVSFTANLPRSLMGPAPAIAMTSIADFGVRGGRASGELARGFEALYAQQLPDMLHGTGQEAFSAVRMLKKANPMQYRPANGAVYPNSPLGQALSQISELIKADVGLEVAFTDVGGWDTHANQGSSRGQLAFRLQDFSQALAALYRDLGDGMRNIVVLTMTEFGRTIRQNGSGGTDHGHASCLFALGGPVKGGKVYGKWPGLATEHLYEGRDLALTTDFRDVFAEVAVRHLGAGDASSIFPGFKASPANFRGIIRS
jgi:uncharacterized protein (DUF1501 family)